MRSRGFTLVEVMVALMVIALALPALLKTLYQQIDGTAYLRDKSIAQWVATNRLAQSRIQLARNDRLVIGSRSGVETMAGRDWYWRTLSEATEVKDFYRLEISVGTEEDPDETPLYRLVGYIASRNASGDRP